MGIARRKAGTSVRCTTCGNDVRVPADEGPASPPPLPEPEPVPDVFDRDDFDALLRRESTARAVVRPGASSESAVLPGLSAPPAVPAGGLVLSPGKATMLTVVLILLLAVAFVAGLLVGRFAL